MRGLQNRIPRIKCDRTYRKCSRIHNGSFWFILRRSQYSDKMASNGRRLVNVLKGFGPNELWPDRFTIPEFVWREPVNSGQVNLMRHNRNSNRVPLEFMELPPPNLFDEKDKVVQMFRQFSPVQILTAYF
jgi:hypothetical protein